METNKVELTGVVGQIKNSSFSLCVSETFTNSQNLIRQNWFRVKAISLPELKTGDTVNIVGKIHTSTYLNSAGEEVYYPEIIAKEINKI